MESGTLAEPVGGDLWVFITIPPTTVFALSVLVYCEMTALVNLLLYRHSKRSDFGAEKSSIRCSHRLVTLVTSPAGESILMNNSTETPWLTSREAASYLRIESRTLLQWAREGKVKGHVLSGIRRHVWRFRHVDLDAMLLKQSVALESKERIN